MIRMSLMMTSMRSRGVLGTGEYNAQENESMPLSCDTSAGRILTPNLSKLKRSSGSHTNRRDASHERHRPITLTHSHGRDTLFNACAYAASGMWAAHAPSPPPRTSHTHATHSRSQRLRSCVAWHARPRTRTYNGASPDSLQGYGRHGWRALHHMWDARTPHRVHNHLQLQARSSTSRRPCASG